MTIRAKLTLWYMTILGISVALITLFSYKEFEKETTALKVEHGEEDTANDSWHDALDISLSCGVPAAVVAFVGGWWLMRRALSPLTTLTEAAARLNEGNLQTQLPRSGNGDEMDKLTEVFNDMTARLSRSFERVREFTLHASHELKTPLTVMHAELETALREEPGANRDRILSQLDEVQRLTKIVDGLSLLTKADAGLITLQSEPVRLDELVRDSFADAQILARPHNVKVELQRCDEVSIPGDRHRLRQLLLNLTDNAIKYNQAGGTVRVDLHRNCEKAELSISNTGPGIPTELQTRIFDRFFRVDASHNNAVEGCGLGLSISQWIVSAHHGKIGVASEPGKLTTITVSLPLAGA